MCGCSVCSNGPFNSFAPRPRSSIHVALTGGVAAAGAAPAPADAEGATYDIGAVVLVVPFEGDDEYWLGVVSRRTLLSDVRVRVVWLERTAGGAEVDDDGDTFFEYGEGYLLYSSDIVCAVPVALAAPDPRGVVASVDAASGCAYARDVDLRRRAIAAAPHDESDDSVDSDDDEVDRARVRSRRESRRAAPSSSSRRRLSDGAYRRMVDGNNSD